MARARIRNSPGEARTPVNVVDPDELVRKILTEHLGRLEFDAVAHDDIQAVLKSADPSSPLVVIFGPSETPGDVIDRIKGLFAFRPGVGAIMIVHDLNTSVLKQALRAGLDDVVSADADDSELRDTVARSISRVVSSQSTPAPSALSISSSGQGRVISVFCTKGGTGKSVVAINLAVALAKRTIQPVVLVDADLQFGDVALMLQLAAHPHHRRGRPGRRPSRRDACSRTCSCGTRRVGCWSWPLRPSRARPTGSAAADLARIIERSAGAVRLHRGRHLGQLRRESPWPPWRRPTTSWCWPVWTS